jgi:hypothetical protein
VRKDAPMDLPIRGFKIFSLFRKKSGMAGSARGLGTSPDPLRRQWEERAAALEAPGCTWRGFQGLWPRSTPVGHSNYFVEIGTISAEGLPRENISTHLLLN